MSYEFRRQCEAIRRHARQQGHVLGRFKNMHEALNCAECDECGEVVCKLCGAKANVRCAPGEEPLLAISQRFMQKCEEAHDGR